MARGLGGSSAIDFTWEEEGQVYSKEGDEEIWGRHEQL